MIMDAEKPGSLRAIITRILGTILALPLIYVLGYGPCVFVAMRFVRTRPMNEMLYRPLLMKVYGTPFEKPLLAYGLWWEWLALHNLDWNRAKPPPPKP